MNNGCPAGNSATEPYIVGHHMLLCHGAAVKVYKEKYQTSQKGQIRITLVSHWFLPYSNSVHNVKAVQRTLDFMYGWFMNPLTYGEYPETMRSFVGKRLPEFTPEQAKLVKGSCDFIGLNYYTGNYASDVPFANSVNVSYSSDSLANITSKGDANNVTTKEGVKDYLRIYFYRRHLGAVENAIKTQKQLIITPLRLIAPAFHLVLYLELPHLPTRDDFANFTELCYKEFGDRVKHWITINEPWTYASQGYDIGALAPGRCSAWRNNDCPAGDSATEPYIVAHHMLLCHGAAVKVYKEKYQASQEGQIGITLVSQWYVPYSNSKSNVEAAQRALDFMYGWFIHPLTYGDYPETMRSIVGKRLPKFTPEQVKLVKGSFDFIGLNYYSGNFASNDPSANSVNDSYSSDSLANLTVERHGKLIGTPTAVSIFYIFPKGLQELLIYTKKKYNNPVIYITENGMGDANNVTAKEGVKDYLRIDFYRRHLGAVQNAIKAGVKVKGFFAWAFLDNFEWGSGYTLRFGLGYVDYHDNLKRYPKDSALWFRKFNLKDEEY
ncbi:hypothetical protein RHMOL_Rhmol07G0062300 [Rhododendron molle]|uniref:Uncharacterized protein n=1 Tax=Rhododendron molle TaxID=49168 RepID=A0ACC0MXN6_RHOML|nr:hypothetical protein RHMOL_Rhmol07G0062300 [Rhododendron molle]